MDIRTHSTTSNRFRVVLKHATTGIGLTGLTEVSAGLIISTIADNEATTTRYRASSSEIETITTLGTFAAPSTNKCRFKEVDATNHKGLYEIQLADARVAVASARKLVVSWTGATNLLDGDYEILLPAVNLHDSVRFGLTALPNAAADAAGGLVISDAGGYDIDGLQSAVVNAVDALLATAEDLAAAVGTRQTGDGTITYDQMLQIVGAAVTGKLSGVGTGTLVFRSISDDLNVLTVTVDATGRTAVTVGSL